MPGRLDAHVGVPSSQPPGIDVADIAEDLRDNGVAATGDEGALADVVDRAADDAELQLSVVTFPDVTGTQEQLRDLARDLATQRGGTVLVLDPGSAVAWSTDHDSDEVTSAVQSVPAGDDAVAAQAFVDELTAPGPPWGWLIGMAIVLVAVIAVGGRWLERRRRRRRDTAALAAEGRRLRAEVADMADDLLLVEPRVTVHSDDEVSDDFNGLAAEYRELTHAVEQDPATRRAADELSARVSAARERLERIRATVDGPAQG